ncbi:MAG TPA: peptidylprolyl isomerase [Vicinamibacterales bacterium]|jgi:cyclophilin family peptidyl-prolyl cis-trans isomerase/HEAT repeat protein|nr:peptidylprolyl isomerase [Vicinamibacterales bacterium]
MLRMHQRVLVFASGLVLLSGCATAPPAAAPTIAFEQKMAWILQLEDRRVLSVPAPPPAVVPGARRGAAPVPAPAPDLARLTTDREPRVRRRAALAVGRVGLKEGIPLLTTLLADADADVRQTAAFALGLIGDASAAPALTPLLADAAPLVRGRAAEALGAIDAKDAAGAIGKMAAEYARSAAVLAMQPDDEPSPSPPEAEAFKLGIFALVRIRAYDALAGAVLDGSGRPISSWWPVAYALRRIEDARAAPALRALVATTGRYTPAFALRGLAAVKDAGAGPSVLPLLEPGKASREVVAEALRAAGVLGVAAAADRAAAIAGDARAEGSLRLEAVAALGALKATDHVPLVQDLITDDWPALRAAALRAAADIDPEGFALVLSGLDHDRHWLVRAALADVLATLPAEVAVDRVRPLLQDEDKRVVPAALRALVRLKVADAPALLLAHLRETDVVIREAAAQLLGESKPEGAVPALVSAYEAAAADASYGVRAAVLGALASYGTPEALAGVRAGLADKDWAVRVHALRLLAKLEPGVDRRLAARPVPNQPVVPFDDPQLAARDFSPHAFIETARGTIEFQLAVLDAPQTARNFMALARKGFFNGLPVHRVVPNFVVQDGDPRGDGEGGPGYTIRDEINDRPYLRGTVGMALSWKDTGGSQFFITHSPQPHLDGRYTVFGHVVNGMDVVDRLQVGDVIEQVRVWDGKSW